MKRSIILVIMFLSALVPSLLAMGEQPASGPSGDNYKVVSGNWQGSLKLAPGIELRLIFELTSTPAGGLTGSMLSVDQGNTRTTISTIVVKDQDARAMSSSSIRTVGTA